MNRHIGGAGALFRGAVLRLLNVFGHGQPQIGVVLIPYFLMLGANKLMPLVDQNHRIQVPGFDFMLTVSRLLIMQALAPAPLSVARDIYFCMFRCRWWINLQMAEDRARCRSRRYWSLPSL